MKIHSKFLALALSLALSLSLLPAAALADGSTPSEGGTAPVVSATEVGDANALIADVAVGGSIQLTDNITLTQTLYIVKDTTIDTNGHTLTITPASGSSVYISDKTAETVLTLTGNFDFGGGTSGILFSSHTKNCSLVLNNADVKIHNTTGYGIYTCTAQTNTFTMNGGSLTIQDCGTDSAEGGIAWDGGTMTFNSGDVSITGCGSKNFGAIYSSADLVFGDGTNDLTVNLENNSTATGVKNAIVLVGGKNMVINEKATVDITMSGYGVKNEKNTCRGINLGKSASTITVNGTLNIEKGTTTADNIIGINGDGCTPKLAVNAGGLVNIAGYSPAENVLPNVYVTMNGGSMDLGGSSTAAPPASTLQLDDDAALNEKLTIAADTTIDTNGHDFTVKPALGEDGIYVNTGAKLKLDGNAAAGSLTVDGSNTTSSSQRGINCAGSLTVESGTVNVENTAGYGIGGDAMGTAFTMTGGTLNITGCGCLSAENGEGGFIWSKGGPSTTCQFLGGIVNMTGCGNTLYGCMYVGCPLTFGDGTDALTVNLENKANSAAALNNTLVICSATTINKNAAVNIKLTGTADATGDRRGVNTAGAALDINGGSLTVTNKNNGTGTTYGIRGAAVTVENGGTLAVAGTTSGVAVRGTDGSLTVKNDAVVNITGTTKPTDGIPVTITGGSMNLGKGVSDAETAGAKSITNGEDPVTLKKQSANDYSVAINKIAAPNAAVYPYTYTSHVTDGGVYAWIPVSCVNFYSDSSKTTLLGICTAAGASTWEDAKAAAPDTTGLTRFKSWVSETGSALTDDTKIDTGEVLNVYATYSAAPSGGGGGGSSSGGGTTITDPEVPQADTPSALNSTDHFAYVAGYGDGTVRPNANITRAEVATMFYRLLTNERRDAIFTAKSSFTDMNSADWYNKAVSSMTNGAYITGYTDGSFGGDKSITRAEFVTIASRFMAAKTGTKTFTDVPAGYWAADSISTAVAYGWIDGYTDGSFKPDQAITRAEAMKIINTMLARGVDASGVTAGTKAWSDNTDASAWYYYDVVEATNGHTYTGTRPSEKWTALGLNFSYDLTKYETPDAK